MTASAKRQYRILTEASGSLTAGYLLQAIQQAGHLAVASDIDEHCFGRALADYFVLMPRASAPDLWEQVERSLVEQRIDVVIPSLDEMLPGWAERRDRLLAQLGVHVVISNPATIATCRDKWLTYQFFSRCGIPCPATSTSQDYALVKPRVGRGAVGLKITSERVDMTGMISQELVVGTEYTVDVFCDRSGAPVYIVPRRRLNVRDGKSTGGIVEAHEQIVAWVRRICSELTFIGPVNMQCFALPDGTVRFIEINPRIAGGMALGFAATENWIDLIVRNLIHRELLTPRPVRVGLEMRRYYAEVFVQRH
jgi:carbamoyl-phosphate synthase large subunit